MRDDTTSRGSATWKMGNGKNKVGNDRRRLPLVLGRQVLCGLCFQLLIARFPGNTYRASRYEMYVIDTPTNSMSRTSCITCRGTHPWMDIFSSHLILAVQTTFPSHLQHRSTVPLVDLCIDKHSLVHSVVEGRREHTIDVGLYECAVNSLTGALSGPRTNQL